jgi:hypothetical protein
MGDYVRSPLRQEVVAALLDSKAINLEAAGAVFSKYAEAAVRGGEELTISVGKWNYLACGWPGPIGPEIGQINVREG